MNEDIRIRQAELMEPIHRQIMMTDDVNDVLILASNMLTTGMMIFYQHYGYHGASKLIDTLAEDAKKQHKPG
jgi:hypothetical protein